MLHGGCPCFFSSYPTENTVDALRPRSIPHRKHNPVTMLPSQPGSKVAYLTHNTQPCESVLILVVVVVVVVVAVVVVVVVVVHLYARYLQMKQTMFLRYTVLQIFCSYNFWYK